MASSAAIARSAPCATRQRSAFTVTPLTTARISCSSSEGAATAVIETAPPAEVDSVESFWVESAGGFWNSVGAGEVVGVAGGASVSAGGLGAPCGVMRSEPGGVAAGAERGGLSAATGGAVASPSLPEPCTPHNRTAISKTARLGIEIPMNRKRRVRVDILDYSLDDRASMTLEMQTDSNCLRGRRAENSIAYATPGTNRLNGQINECVAEVAEVANAPIG